MDEKLSGEKNGAIENSRISADQETRITIREDENCENTGIVGNGDGDNKSSGLGLNKGLSDGVGVGEERCSCALNVKCGPLEGEGEGESQRVCRICHLSKWENEKDSVDLIELGCGCKGELGFAHSHCAEAWFKLRGNRLCEICGKIANNITGAGASEFMEEWNERRLAGFGDTLSERRRGCWHGQPLCNFLMACLVIAFVLPWFFRVNMF